MTLQPNTLRPGTDGAAYNQVITAVGGNAPLVLNCLRARSPGLMLDDRRHAARHPDNAGSRSFPIEATDKGQHGFRPYRFSTGTVGGVTITPASLPAGSQGVAYNQALGTTGGTGSGRVFSITSGSLPAGVNDEQRRRHQWHAERAAAHSILRSGSSSTRRHTGSRAYTLNIGGTFCDGQPVDAAERDALHAVQPDRHRERRHRPLHIRDQRRLAADRPVARRQTAISPARRRSPGPLQLHGARHAR